MTHNEIIDTLVDKGFEAYVIGGAVRDAFLNKAPTDFDIVTNATPNEIDRLFGKDNTNFVGKSFGVCLIDGIEVASYRTDAYEGFNNKKVKVAFVKSLYTDLGRRDFTFNAIAMERSGNCIDPHGGIDDLNKRLIRFVGYAPKRIWEDTNRIIRGCRFVATIDGVFETDTLKAIKAYVANDEIKHIAPERIRKEILKAMEVKKASKFFIALHEIGALKYIFPALEESYGHEHGKHHIENVFDHAMLVGDSISTKNPLLKLAGYLHDIGKPASFDSEEKTFYLHHKFGQDIVKHDLSKLKFSTKEIDFISSVVRLHMLQSPKKNRTVRRILKKFVDYNVDYRDWLRLFIADRSSNLKKSPYTISEIKNIISQFINFKNNVYETIKLPVDGLDVMELLQISQGKEVGNVLKNLLNYVIQEGDAVNNRQHLILKIMGEGLQLTQYIEPEGIKYE